jgi:hypothetical protein
VDLQAQMQELLDQYERNSITQAQGPLSSLGFTSKMSPRTGRRRQIGRRMKKRPR